MRPDQQARSVRVAVEHCITNGAVLGRPGGGNVLTHAVLRLVREGAQAAGWEGPIAVYGAANRLSERTLEGAGVTFRQTPYDIRARV